MRYAYLPLAATAATFLAAAAALAHDGVHINDAYARFLPAAMSGAAFLEVENHQIEDDRLIGASSPIAETVELHTHVESADGMMQMRQIEGGIVIPANGSAFLARGGDHLMFMGLTTRPKDGDVISVTLTFERAGEVTIEVPVDNSREPEAMPMGDHAGHGAMHGTTP